MSGGKIMNKKAAIFALLITIAVFVLCGYALFKFITAKTGAAEMFAPPDKVLKMNEEISVYREFAAEAAKIAVANAYQNISDEGKFAPQDCKVYSGYLHFCNFTRNFDEEFATDIGERMNEINSLYYNPDFNKIKYKASIKDKIINFDSNEIELKGSVKGVFGYSFMLDFKSSFAVDLEDINLASFQEIWQKADECKAKEDIALCMNLGSFNIETGEISEIDMKSITMKSKSRYFINEEYRNIEVRFSI
ncbi:MAG: hypothetical protein V1886_03670 [archaeon]